MPEKSRLCAQLGIGLAAVMCLGGAAGAANSPPRYALSVGERLIYKTSTVTTGKEPNEISHETTDISVLQLNPDGSWRVFEQDTTEDATADGHKQDSGPSSEIKLLDIFPEVHPPADDELDETESSDVFPSLPPSDKTMKSGWIIQVNSIEDQNYQVIQNGEKEFVESAYSSGLMDQVYQQKSSAKIQFDRALGIVTSIDSTESEDYGHHTKTSTTTRLVSAEKINATALQQLAADAETMRQARKLSDDLWWQQQKGAKRNSQETTEQRKSLLLAASSRVKTESIKADLSDYAKALAEAADEDAKDDAQWAALIGKPSPPWDATDLNGHKHSLAGYRGKVLVLDFWFRGCEPCMIAMPQVKQFVQEYKGKDVAALAVTFDDPADAKFVGQVFGLPYPIVQAMQTQILLVYQVHNFPTILIIDQRGILRSMDIGFDKDTSARLKKEIDGLLAAKPVIPKARPFTITTNE